MDDATKMVRINDPNHPESIDLSVGRYDVTISTAAAYATKRQESAAQLMELAKQSPQLIEAAGDLIIKELDLINGDKIGERVKRAMDPAILGDDGDDNMSEEEKQRQRY
jgi:hypothetical protein